MSDLITKEAPIITITEQAADEIRDMQQNQPEHQGKPLRVYIEKGGCSGMQYGMVFDEIRDGDAQWNMHNVDLVIDQISAEYLKGSVIDFSDSLNQGGFKLTNPRAKHSCGCGKSFEV
jgi:iron-sulfur cluster assembly accessory protein